MVNNPNQEILNQFLQAKHTMEGLSDLHAKTMKRALSMDTTVKSKLVRAHETTRVADLLEQSARLKAGNTAGAREILSSVMQTRAAHVATCPNCGAKIVKGNTFCATCGGKLKA